MDEIHYSLENDLPVAEFREVLISSTLGERRPVDDLQRLEKMLNHANIIVTARLGGRLVGVARAMSDFSFCCYLVDLAVDVAHQKRGIGKRLIREVRQHSGDLAALILIAAPAAEHYYAKVGLEPLERGWLIPRVR